MTSYVLGAHVGREIHPDYAIHKPSKTCPFCKIVDKSIGAKAHVVYEDDLCIAFLGRSSPAPSSWCIWSVLSPDPVRSTSDEGGPYPAHSQGEGAGPASFGSGPSTRCMPALTLAGRLKIHCPRISDLPPEEGAALGMALPKVTAAITKGAHRLPLISPTSSADG